MVEPIRFNWFHAFKIEIELIFFLDFSSWFIRFFS
jgi:hypothetical protein